MHIYPIVLNLSSRRTRFQEPEPGAVDRVRGERPDSDRARHHLYSGAAAGRGLRAGAAHTADPVEFELERTVGDEEEPGRDGEPGDRLGVHGHVPARGALPLLRRRAPPPPALGPLGPVRPGPAARRLHHHRHPPRHRALATPHYLVTLIGTVQENTRKPLVFTHTNSTLTVQYSVLR